MRRYLAALAAGLALSPWAAWGAQGRYNVVVVDICSARADRFGLYGYGRDTTPGLDALSRETVVFDRAMAQSSWCLPNYASLFTGHLPEVHGLYTNLPREVPEAIGPNLAERLKQAGYDTAAFTGGVYFLPPWALSQGFDTFVNSFSTAAASPAPIRQSIPAALSWIKERRDRPFFLYMTADDLHAPYQSKEPERYDPGYEGVVHDTETINVRFFRAFNEKNLDPGHPLAAKVAEFRKDPRHLRHLTAHYDAALHSLDRDLHAFLQDLKGKGLWKKTVVIVTSDHGEMLGEHGLLGHTEGLYEPVARVPLLVHHPDFSRLAGKRLSALVQRLDLTPTILEAAGAPPPAEGPLPGRSLIPLLRNPQAAFRTYAFASSKRNLGNASDFLIDERAVRTDRWKLHAYLHKDAVELYDLQADPLETRDVSALHPDVAARLLFELTKHFEVWRPHAPGAPWEPRSMGVLWATPVEPKD